MNVAGSMKRTTVVCRCLLLVVLAAPIVQAADDLVIADFESDSYGDWEVVGNAFGRVPAIGAFEGQMPVSGFTGHGLVNSNLGGDGATGSLISPEFSIDRSYIRFLIGGGGFPGATCLRLMVNDEVVREATGLNKTEGGSESLNASHWDVKELAGKRARIVILDNATGQWGHINVDEIVLTDEEPTMQSRQRDLVIDQDYLLIPISNGAPKVKLEVAVAGRPVRRYDTELATDPEQVDWCAFFNLSTYHGEPAQINASMATEDGFALIRTASRVPAAAENYDEPLRPQLRFSQLVGWINDPNGMVYLDGEWHLFFQHNPVGWAWGNMTWGHAVSPDLVHWRQLPNVLFPTTTAKGACFSGGAIVDKQNTGGWKTGDEDVLVVFLTDTGAGEALAYSNDNGRTFTWYEGNPVIRHRGRDPKVIWYEYKSDDAPIDEAAARYGGHWVMVVYDEDAEAGHNTAFYTSTDLKSWAHASNLTGYYECPELFNLPVEGASGDTRWVTFAADGHYTIGRFDGRVFTPEHETKHRLHYGNFYASQLFSNAPDDRRVQIGWLSGIEFKQEAFNQAFSVPHVLSLRQAADGVRMFAAPAEELNSLRTSTQTAVAKRLADGEAFSLPVSGELFDIEMEVELRDAQSITLDACGNRFHYDVATKAWNKAATAVDDGHVTLRVLLDRSIVEAWGNEGAVVLSGLRKTVGSVSEVKVTSIGGDAKLVRLEIHELMSIWRD